MEYPLLEVELIYLTVMGTVFKALKLNGKKRTSLKKKHTSVMKKY